VISAKPKEMALMFEVLAGQIEQGNISELLRFAHAGVHGKNPSRPR
jgi:hypothetical protein